MLTWRGELQTNRSEDTGSRRRATVMHASRDPGVTCVRTRSGARAGRAHLTEVLVTAMRELHHRPVAQHHRPRGRAQYANAAVAPALRRQLVAERREVFLRDAEAQLVVITAGERELAGALG